MGMCDYRTEQFEIPKGKYQYEVARDDDRGADPARSGLGFMLHFFVILIVTSTVDRMVYYDWGKRDLVWL